MNAITTTSPAMPMQDLQILADAIARSNLFGIKTKEQALVLMMIARSEGRDPVEAARDYDIIQGKPAKKAEAMLRDFLVAGGKVEWHELSDNKADATFTHPQTGKVRIDWDMHRATVAGFGGKDMWKKFPRQMLRSRVVSEGVRTLWPLATSGMYVPEEQADIERKGEEHVGPTMEHDAREAINTEVPLRAAAASMQRAPRVVAPERVAEYEGHANPVTPQYGEARSNMAVRSNMVPGEGGKPHPLMPNGAVDPNPVDALKPQRTDEQWRVWLDKLRAACEVLRRRHEVVEIGERASVGDALASGPDWVQREISAILAENYQRCPEEPSGDDLPEVEIAGAEKLSAG